MVNFEDLPKSEQAIIIKFYEIQQCPTKAYDYLGKIPDNVKNLLILNFTLPRRIFTSILRCNSLFTDSKNKSLTVIDHINFSVDKLIDKGILRVIESTEFNQFLLNNGVSLDDMPRKSFKIVYLVDRYEDAELIAKNKLNKLKELKEKRKEKEAKKKDKDEDEDEDKDKTDRETDKEEENNGTNSKKKIIEMINQKDKLKDKLKDKIDKSGENGESDCPQ